MLYSIENNELAVTINSRGAELWSIKNKDNIEFIWQGDSAYWSDRSPTLFPYIGRMINKRYSYMDKSYSMDIHGFALSMEFEPIKQSKEELVFQLKSSDETKIQYPWSFIFNVAFRLNNNQLEISFIVENKDSTSMLFAVGGHPGFFVPLQDSERFEDYRLRFPEPHAPERIIFTEDCFVQPYTESYKLDSNNSIPLRHDLFDQDAIVLKNTGKTVILESDKGNHSVTVTFPDMDYIGFWHLPKCDAPYVCIEPWSSLPSAKGNQTVWDHQSDLLKLEPGAVYINKWFIAVK